MAKRNWIKAVEFNSENITVRFQPIDNVPGFGHMVFITAKDTIVAKDWLSDELSPAAKHADFYVEKHAAKIVALKG